ncbi:MAG: dihydrolipoamide acetyltransferase component of pyruvate dehydrogenase complex [Candidatus Roseilinea sp.]|jgi:2-oxoglutarate dehydrogenase E2 component (dihydrolipoamide succinyltransferase)|nr:MAG: dihydrolipoamide acetyltransferase component of pyruvate dehydrogenase complex [Candidatus Roseilinea sp.]
MGTQVVMPQLGESVVEGKISKWLKKVGDPVKLYEPIFEVETDKVTTEVTAPSEGTLLKLYVNEGDTVPAGALVAYIGQPGETAPEGGAIGAHAAQSEVHKPEAQPAPRRTSIRLSPVVARIAAEHNVDVSQVVGTGEGGRITKQDILAFIESRLGASGRPASEEKRAGVGSEAEPAPWDYPSSGELFKPSEETRPPQRAEAHAATAPAQGDQILPLSNMRRAIAEHMVRSVQTSPHATTVWEVDCARIVAHREANRAAFERDGVRLTLLPYFIAAAVHALRQHPRVNASWDERGIVLHRQINIGIAVSLDDGLIVPVIRDAGALNLLGLARAVQDLADRARHNRLRPEDVEAGTFTITNHGGFGSLLATPIIHQPQCAILGIGKVEKRPVVVEVNGADALAIRPMAYLSLSFDHRALDGADADRFMTTLKRAIETWETS